MTFHAFADTSLDSDESVLSILDNYDSTYTIHCENGDEGSVSIEEENICALSNVNDKNFCNLSTIWTIEDAASLICSPDIEE